MKCDKHYWDRYGDKLFSTPKRLSDTKVAKYMNYWKTMNEDALRRKRMFDAFEICDYILDNRKRKSIPINAELNDLIAKYEKTSEDVVMIDNQNYVGEMDEDDDYEQADMEAWVKRESY